MRKIPYIFSDIDGVLLRGKMATTSAKDAVAVLSRPLSKLFPDLFPEEVFKDQKIPFVCITNSGGLSEAKKAEEVNEILQLNTPRLALSSKNIVCNFSPLRQYLKNDRNSLFLVMGVGQIEVILGSLGITRYITLREYMLLYPEIFGAAVRSPYFPTALPAEKEILLNELAERLEFPKEKLLNPFPCETILLLNDEIQWNEGIQLICDHLISSDGKFPGQYTSKISRPQIQIIALNPFDTIFSDRYTLPRFAFGTFYTSLEAISMKLFGEKPEMLCIGKPEPITFQYACKLFHFLRL